MDDIQELYALFPDVREHICIERKIGQGTFSYVYLGHFLKSPDERVALKYIIPTSAPTRTRQEIECLLNIGGQDNVVGILSVLRNKSHILLLMPYIEHEPFHESFIFWSVDEIREYIRSLLIALNRVHQCGVIHRDVKPSNFLYDRRRKQYALVDFGLAQTYDKSSTENVFVYEKLNRKPLAVGGVIENSLSSCGGGALGSGKKNLIAITNQTSGGGSVKKTSASSLSSHLILTNTQHRSSPSTPKTNAVNSLPHGPQKDPPGRDSNTIANVVTVVPPSSSQSFDRHLSKLDNFNNESPNNLNQQQQQQQHQSTRVLSPVNNNGNGSSSVVQATSAALTAIKNAEVKPSSMSSSKATSLRTGSPSFQKFHSFHKTSLLTENKCNCFNTQFVCDVCTSRNNKWAPRAGTAGFRAPEILFRSSFQTPSIDVWSAGVIFLSLLSGRYPFFKAVDDTMAIMQLVSLFGVEPVKRGAFKYGESLLCSHDTRLTDLKTICVDLRRSMIKGMSEQQKARKKLSQRDLDSIERDFPDSAYDLLRRLLEIDCEKRLTAEAALQHAFFTASRPTTTTSSSTSIVECCSSPLI